MYELQIDQNKCCRCQACVRDCSFGALAFSPLGPDWAPEGGAERCTLCMHCFAICPTGALSIAGRNPAKSAKPDRLPDAAQVFQLIQTRRTCRNYQQRNLPRPILRQLTDAMSWVPTGVNDHRLHFGLVDDIDRMREFRKILNEKLLSAIRNDTLAPEIAHFKRFEAPLAAGGDPIFRTAPHLVIASAPEDSPCPTVDPIIALAYFELLAHALDVGTTWCGLAYGAIRYCAPELLPRLGVPDGYRPGYVMLFGPPAVRYARATQPESAYFSTFSA